MWPFSKKKPNPIPTIRCGEVEVTWNTELNWWEFSKDGVDYWLVWNPVFDPRIFLRLEEINGWVTQLEPQINEEIKKHLKNWCDDWSGNKDRMDIDVSWLVERGEIEVSYAHEDWADLGIYIVIREGKIVDSSACD
jgi:hypothetical protein